MLKRLGPRPPAVAMLGAQAVAHGLLCILTIVPAAGLFLSSYGADQLPYVYLAVAFAGISTAPLLGRALSRWPIATVARPILLGIGAMHLVCWAAIERTGVHWPAIVIQVLLPITLQLGFVLLGSQAGRLLTMREMKAWFSLVASGFSMALLVGGLIVPFLVDVLGATHHLLVLTAASAGLLVILINATHRRYADRLAIAPKVQHSLERDAPAPVGTPFRRLVGLILGYQVCSSLGTQLGEYFLFDRAAARYATSEELARFAAHFNVALNVVELIFLALAAGPLLERFGLRFGLSANPVALLSGFAAAAVVGPVAGIGSFAMLICAAASRTGDITLTNSTTRAATNTAFQALPFAVRPAVQARTEGLAVPAAIGLSGIMLLIIERFGGEVQAVVGVSIVVCVIWLIVTKALFSQYRKQLHDNLAHRVMSPLVRAGEFEIRSALTPGAHDACVPDRIRPTRSGSNDHCLSDMRLLAQRIRHADADSNSVDYLIDLSATGPRSIAALARKRLSRLLPPADPRRPSLASDGIQASLRFASEVGAALQALPMSTAAMPLRQALLDEARANQDHVLASLALVLNPDAITRAALWLDGSDHERATAIESIEVNAPREHRAAVLAVLTMRDDLNGADRRLREAGATPPGVKDCLCDLRDDPRRVWDDVWLSVCADYALLGTRSAEVLKPVPALSATS